MSTQDHERFATTLLERAASDLAALKLLAAAESTREIAGFHAQQAVEKSLKSALFRNGVEPPRTHNLRYLLDLATQAGLAPPLSESQADELTPYAVDFRYVPAPEDANTLEIIPLVESVVAWAVQQPESML